MLFWGCEENLKQSTKLIDRFFPFDLLKDNKHDHQKLKTAFPLEKFKQVVQQVLRNNYPAAQGTPECNQFNQLCNIFEFMCAEKRLKRYLFLFLCDYLCFRSAPSPSDRLPAARCLGMLNEAFPSATAAAADADAANAAADADAAAARPQPHALSTFNHLSKFIDSFCASGSIQVDYDVRKIPDDKQPVGSHFEVRQAWDRLNITTAKYNPKLKRWTPGPMHFVMNEPQQLTHMDQQPWLYVHKESSRYDGIPDGRADGSLQRRFDRLKDSIEYPDYFVCPDSDIERGFFLPVNKFSYGFKLGESMLDADRLELVRHGDWFTVLRYKPQASSEGSPHESIIIKRSPINNSTFKYLLHEKTMLRYLNGSERIAVERLDGGFASLLLWKMNRGSYQNDRFIAYQDGGRPLQVQFFDNPSPPLMSVILRIAQDLLQALIFLYDKRVVHRNLNLGTVVFSDAGGAKLIALGTAKYINHLPYEDRIRAFEGIPRQQPGSFALRGIGSPPPPTTTYKPEQFVHPSLRGDSSVSPAFEHDW
jgi:hypothetical protein